MQRKEMLYMVSFIRPRVMKFCPPDTILFYSMFKVFLFQIIIAQLGFAWIFFSVMCAHQIVFSCVIAQYTWVLKTLVACLTMKLDVKCFIKCVLDDSGNLKKWHAPKTWFMQMCSLFEGIVIYCVNCLLLSSNSVLFFWFSNGACIVSGETDKWKAAQLTPCKAFILILRHLLNFMMMLFTWLYLVNLMSFQ